MGSVLSKDQVLDQVQDCRAHTNIIINVRFETDVSQKSHRIFVDIGIFDHFSLRIVILIAADLVRHGEALANEVLESSGLARSRATKDVRFRAI